MPKRKHVGWDLGQTMEWRGPSTAVLSFALLVQCGDAWQALLVVGFLANVGTCVLSGPTYRNHRSDHVMVAVGSIFLAVIFTPLLMFAWLFGRDPGHMPYAPADS
ncbi:hypothetical protein GCM10018785_67130 [Streptomyces longispororuber]|uniref:Uncharacterized protein n=1 Tax=Streptomyces longispororuber TaxID=68230 RepID=A0A919DYK6_9ACTN|nr:hypothetical protein GCM10018785_67130 [Streptomyces longispororuber]